LACFECRVAGDTSGLELLGNRKVKESAGQLMRQVELKSRGKKAAHHIVLGQNFLGFLISNK
jgi:hypothetical protein